MDSCCFSLKFAGSLSDWWSLLIIIVRMLFAIDKTSSHCLRNLFVPQAAVYSLLVLSTRISPPPFFHQSHELVTNYHSALFSTPIHPGFFPSAVPLFDIVTFHKLLTVKRGHATTSTAQPEPSAIFCLPSISANVF